MHVVGKDYERPHRFQYELWDGFELVECVGGFRSKSDAQKAAENAQRMLMDGTLSMASDPFYESELEGLSGMTSDEILRELGC